LFPPLPIFFSTNHTTRFFLKTKQMGKTQPPVLIKHPNVHPPPLKNTLFFPPPHLNCEESRPARRKPFPPISCAVGYFPARYYHTHFNPPPSKLKKITIVIKSVSPPPPPPVSSCFFFLLPNPRQLQRYLSPLDIHFSFPPPFSFSLF